LGINVCEFHLWRKGIDELKELMIVKSPCFLDILALENRLWSALMEPTLHFKTKQYLSMQVQHTTTFAEMYDCHLGQEY
jgi:hypothetical protein